MTMAAYAVNADEGFIYVRGEYELAQRRLANAIQQAKQAGLVRRRHLGH